MSDRRNAADYAAAGGALIAGSLGADAAVAHDRKVRRMDGPIKAATKRQFTRRHAAQVGVKAVGRSMGAVGIPLAAYGAYNMASPKGSVARLSVKRDVVKPVAESATFRDAVRHQENLVKKSDLTAVDTKKLVQRKKKGRKLSLAGAGLGVAALGLRAPEAARALTKVPKVGSLKALATVSRHEPAATKASNAVGTVALGTGAIGSLNYAAQQKLEAKQVAKAQEILPGMPLKEVASTVGPKKAIYSAGERKEKVRVLHQHSKTHFMVHRPSVGRSLVARSALTFIKSDDRFLRHKAQYISPEAENGYRYLRSGRNKAVAQGGVDAGFAGLAGAGTGIALRRGAKGWAGVGAAATLLNTVGAVQQGKKARSWNQKMGKIKAKASEREAVGQLGRGRLVEKADNRKNGALTAAAGAGAIGVGLGHNRLLDIPGQRAHDRNEGKYRRTLAEIGPQVDRKTKLAIQAAHDSHKANKAKIIRRYSGNKRTGLLVGGIAAGIPLMYQGSRNMVTKAVSQKDVDAATAGGVAGAAAYQGAGYLGKLNDKKIIDPLINSHSEYKKTVSNHRNAMGHAEELGHINSGVKNKKFYRSYPTHAAHESRKTSGGLTGAAKWKRMNSRLFTGKTGMGLTLGAAGVGAVAAGAKNHRRDQKVGKALGLPRLRVPGGSLLRKPSIRQSTVRTTPTGKQVTVNGSVR